MFGAHVCRYLPCLPDRPRDLCDLGRDILAVPSMPEGFEMSYWCIVCNSAIVEGNVIVVCEGKAKEPVPDMHKQIRVMHRQCAASVGMTKVYPVYDWEALKSR